MCVCWNGLRLFADLTGISDTSRKPASPLEAQSIIINEPAHLQTPARPLPQKLGVAARQSVISFKLHFQRSRQQKYNCINSCIGRTLARHFALPLLTIEVEHKFGPNFAVIAVLLIAGYNDFQKALLNLISHQRL